MKRSIAIRVVLVLVVTFIVVLGRGFFFYRGLGFYHGPAGNVSGYEPILVPPASMAEFADVYEQGEGIILVDWAHGNEFRKEELNVLLLRLVSRGLTVNFLTEDDDLEVELLGEKKAEKEKKPEKKPSGKETSKEEKGKSSAGENLTKEKPEEKPEKVVAFVVVCPQSEFSREEVKIIDEFVDDGGKLLLIDDPPRYFKINSLSVKFGLIFERDFLYNMKENEINYRNIFVSEFKETDITKGLWRIALYGAGSVSSSNSSIAFADENTFSSVIETRTKLSPIALAQDSRILAIYDLTFMTEPYNGVLDNNRLISNIADWLMPPAKEAKSKP